MTNKNAVQIYNELKADFPPEAYSTDSSRGFDLTSLKAQYARERLNEVLGIDGWRLAGSFQEHDNGGVLYFGTLSIRVGDAWHLVEGVGYSAAKKAVGDAYKGAMTDCLSKTASNLGLGNEMFKGNVAPSKKAAYKEKPAKPPKKVVPKAASSEESPVSNGAGFARPTKKSAGSGAWS